MKETNIMYQYCRGVIESAQFILAEFEEEDMAKCIISDKLTHIGVVSKQEVLEICKIEDIQGELLSIIQEL